MKIKVMSVFGTRPEAIKMLPLVKAIQANDQLESIVCITAQHREMLDHVLHTFGVTADYDLNLMMPRQTLTDITTKVLSGLDEVLEKARPDIVLVHGDTTTSFAAALAAFYKQIPIGHVEAGLRTYNIYSPFPEEANRNLTSKLTTMHFAPTEMNRENLKRESITAGVYVTGNTVIDALLSIVRDDYVFEDENLRAMTFGNERTILLTSHRRENLGEPMRNIFSAILDVVNEYDDLRVVYPMHLNPAVREPAREILGNHPRINLIEPIGVGDMHNLFAKCYMILTDSGGIQEEAPALGKPVLVLRTETERPEAVETGVVKVAGTDKDNLVKEIKLLLDDAQEYAKMSNAKNPYGDGHASQRICEAIIEAFKNK